MLSPTCAKVTKWQQARMHNCAEVYAFIKNRQTIYANMVIYLFRIWKWLHLWFDVTFNRYFPLRKMGSNMDKNHSWQGNLMFPFFWGLMVSLRRVFTIIIFLFFDFLFSQTNTFSHDCASLKAKPVYNQSANIWH